MLVPKTDSNQGAVCSLRSVSKSFGSLKALSDVSFDIRRGEFLALIGENGAGKSTAVSVLFGLLEPDTGHVEVEGTPRRFVSARDPLDAGFGIVHQHFKLYPELTVI
ncbi:MAG: ATP-binding cassette domain-containing protein, partial [Hyphomicrobiales bacterium]|nr:ATP-binding cassette domain-containing protein [Hyphomicrobiales bacterium]